MILYRAISRAEKIDYESSGQFRTNQNTLEAKQFFKSEIAVKEFARIAQKRNYRPPYTCFLEVDISDDCLNESQFHSQILDGFEAITITEDNLPTFNNCVNLVVYNEL